MKHVRGLFVVALACIGLWPGLSGAADPPTVLITGASRGIGLEFTRQFAAKGWRVIATARNPSAATALAELARTDPDVQPETLDVTDHAGIDALARKYDGQTIDLLLLNAAMGPTAETAMDQLPDLDWDLARRSFEVNAIGPLKVTQAFLPHLLRSERRQIVAISSDSGSFVAGSQAPILYHYKASKAALNMYFHTLAFEGPRRKMTVVMLHPGIVGTNHRLARFPGAMKTDESVALMMGVLERLTPADNGRFLDYRGETMPW